MNNFLLNRSTRTVLVTRLRPLIRLFFCVLSLVIFSPSAFAAEKISVATIARAKNSSSITSVDGTSRTAVARMPIYVGDSIETSDDAWLTLNFFDLTRLVLRPGTKVVVRKFPQTMTSEKIEFEVFTGGMRVTTGTLAAQYPESFSVITPHGELSGGRSEWVLRICNQNDCALLEQTFSQCSDYESVDNVGKQFLSVYRGVVNYEQCPILENVNVGQTAVFDHVSQSCQVLEEVPCFILFDQKLGRDQIRSFLPKLTPTPRDSNPRPPKRPTSRTVQPRPRVNRPRRPQRGR
jgi:hypothetical protein